MARVSATFIGFSLIASIRSSARRDDDRRWPPGCRAASHALSAANVASLIAATAHAERIGLPFTRAICIHWQSAGVPLSGMAKATGRFTALLAKFLGRHHAARPGSGRTRTATGRADTAHVPAALVSALTRLQLGWLRRITGRRYRARVIYSRPIGKRLGSEVSNPSDHAINLGAALPYA